MLHHSKNSLKKRKERKERKVKTRGPIDARWQSKFVYSSKLLIVTGGCSPKYRIVMSEGFNAIIKGD
jgi:hypothetical protein